MIRVLAEIRDGIKDLAGSRESGTMTEIADLDYIKQQAEAGLFSWVSVTHLVYAMNQVVQRVQAPKRDEETKEKFAVIDKAMCAAAEVLEEQPRAFCKALEYLLDRVNAMRIDAANARLRLIAPVIKDHGIDYERGKFQDKLNDGTFTLERTQAWINGSVKQCVADSSVELDALLEGKARAFVYVHTTAMLQLVTSTTTVKADMVPETLSFDVHRLSMLQNEFQFLVMACTILVSIGHYLAADAAIVLRIGEEIIAPLKTMDQEAMMAAVADTLDQTALAAERKEGVMHVITQCTSPADVVQRVIGRRLKALVMNIMMTGKTLGLHENAFMQVAKPLFARIELLATKLMSLGNLNRTVHLPTYNKLVGEAALAQHRRPVAASVAAPKRKK